MTRAHSGNIDGSAIVWQGNVNGIHVECITRSLNDVLYLRGIATVYTIGAELVDKEGRRRAFNFRYRGCP